MENSLALRTLRRGESRAGPVPLTLSDPGDMSRRAVRVCDVLRP